MKILAKNNYNFTKINNILNNRLNNNNEQIKKTCEILCNRIKKLYGYIIMSYDFNIFYNNPINIEMNDINRENYIIKDIDINNLILNKQKQNNKIYNDEYINISILENIFLYKNNTYEQINKIFNENKIKDFIKEIISSLSSDKQINDLIKPYEGIFINEFNNQFFNYINKENKVKKKIQTTFNLELTYNKFNFNNYLSDKLEIEQYIYTLIKKFKELIKISNEIYDINKVFIDINENKNQLINVLLDNYVNNFENETEQIRTKVNCKYQCLFFVVSNNDSNDKCYKQFNLINNNLSLFNI